MPEPRVIYYRMDTVAALVIDDRTGKPFRVERMRRWLMREEACRKIGGRWYTTPMMLREAFPEVWHEIQSELPEAGDGTA